MNIEQLEQKYAELGKEIEALKAKDSTWPQIGKEYWYVSESGILTIDVYNSHKADKDRLSIGNFYRTEAEAYAQLEAMKVLAELRACEGYRPFVIGEENYCIRIVLTASFVTVNSWAVSDSGWQSIYFEYEDVALNAINRVGKDRILKAARWLAMREV